MRGADIAANARTIWFFEEGVRSLFLSLPGIARQCCTRKRLLQHAVPHEERGIEQVVGAWRLPSPTAIGHNSEFQRGVAAAEHGGRNKSGHGPRYHRICLRRYVGQR